MKTLFERFPLGALWANGYLFWAEENEKPAFFIDPGGDASEVLSFAKANGLDLRAVLLTHGHIDHIAGIEDFVPIVGDNIYIAEGDAELLRHPPEAMMRAIGVECGGVEKFKTVADGDAITIGPFSVKVIATPGHTPGSVCYLIEENILVSGDTLFADSVGRTDLPGGDWGQLVESLKKLAALPDDTEVFPGHGPMTTIGHERGHNPFWPAGCGFMR
ncbi:MAG: MBL fold metallo-hydrolase [Synergistaceae bacterium]|jgi:glyoxylase-like metal-dependent hydrolase (beta-lactamase superfamily II)|nr:MBL fold metallo-hydrolase [Synergistaceae bacterium]